MASPLARVALAALVVLVIAWLAVSYRSVELEADAETLFNRAAAEGPPSAVELKDARDDLRGARRFNADTTPLITEGALLATSGNRRDAAVLARQATQEEPDNVQAWLLAYAAAPDQAARARAKREAIRLNPWTGELLP